MNENNFLEERMENYIRRQIIDNAHLYDPNEGHKVFLGKILGPKEYLLINRRLTNNDIAAVVRRGLLESKMWTLRMRHEEGGKVAYLSYIGGSKLQ